MPRRLDARQKGFERELAAFLALKRESEADVDAVVAGILDAVRKRGDAALTEFTLRFDHVDLEETGMRFSAGEIAAAAGRCDAETIAALRAAAGRIEAFHRKQLPEDISYTDQAGVRLGARWTPIAAAGLYVPGGLAAYPSS
ncbi:MAG: histidinol dehydrogenase, partial [Alphaproteobacteria bacterium]